MQKHLQDKIKEKEDKEEGGGGEEKEDDDEKSQGEKRVHTIEWAL